VYGAASPQTALALAEVAASLDYLGSAPAAGPLYEHAVAIAGTALGPEHPIVVGLLHNFGANRLDALEFDDAAAVLERALALRERIFGPDNPRVAETLSNLAHARLGQRRVFEAGALEERALRIFEAAPVTGSTHALLSWAILAQVAQLKGNLAEADRMFQRVVEGRRKAGDQSGLAEAYRGETSVLLELGNLAGARTAIDQAVAIELKLLGADHPDRAETLSVLGDVLRAERRFAGAVPVYRQSLALWQRQYGADSPALAETLTGLCEALLATGDGPGARTHSSRAVDVARRAPAEVRAGAQFCLAEAEFLVPAERPTALARARDARAQLAALPYPARDLPRIEGWLAKTASKRLDLPN
jgi:tetratricopeptide (TPR) repeat protein